MDKILRFDFEAFLQKHFGLEGRLRSDLDASDAKLYETHDIDEFFTKEGWAAWQRALEFFQDCAEIGLITDSQWVEISAHFCDNA